MKTVVQWIHVGMWVIFLLNSTPAYTLAESGSMAYHISMVHHAMDTDGDTYATPGLNRNPLHIETDTLTGYDKYGERLSVLIEEFSDKDFDIAELMKDSRFRIYEGIGERFTGSAERRTPDVNEYKKVLGFDNKKNEITAFIRMHEEDLNHAEITYGIPRFVIAAILGIESDYGKNTGNYNPFNAYVSMYAVDYRASFAKAQLEELLLFTLNNDLDVFEMKSSYAGAVSFAQFLPYSLNRWFVGDDIFDMKNNIDSVANYLAHFKEVTGSVEDAVYRYNPSRMYTRAVLDLAEQAEEMAGSQNQ